MTVTGDDKGSMSDRTDSMSDRTDSMSEGTPRTVPAGDAAALPGGSPPSSGEAGEDAVVVTRVDPAAPIVRRRRLAAQRRRLTTWQAVATVAFLVLAGALVWLGYRTSLQIGGGSALRITDPSAPGYVAEPQASEVDLFAVEDADGAFASALVVVPDGSGTGGAAATLPPSLVVPAWDDSPPMFMSDVYAEGGIDGLRERLGVALGFRINAAETVPAAAVEALAADGIELDNPDNLSERLEDGSQEVRYTSGDMRLAPEEVVPFLAFTGADDPAPNQALRSQLVWEQLLGGLDGVDPEELPRGAEAEFSESPGFGPALASFVAGDHGFASLPIARVPVPDSYLVAWMPDDARLDEFVARFVPLPRSPVPGVRVPVQILNGTTDDEAIARAVPAAVAAGAEVVLVGNAESFDVAATRVEYADPSLAGVAEAIAASLGGTATVVDAEPEGAGISVVLGADAA